MKTGNKVLGIVAIVLGAFAIVTFYVPIFNIVSLIAAIVGLVLAILSKKSFTEAGQTSPVPTVGLVLSIIGLVLAFIGFLSCTVCTACIASTVSLWLAVLFFRRIICYLLFTSSAGRSAPTASWWFWAHLPASSSALIWLNATAVISTISCLFCSQSARVYLSERI